MRRQRERAAASPEVKEVVNLQYVFVSNVLYQVIRNTDRDRKREAVLSESQIACCCHGMQTIITLILIITFTFSQFHITLALTLTHADSHFHTFLTFSHPKSISLPLDSHSYSYSQ